MSLDASPHPPSAAPVSLDLALYQALHRSFDQRLSSRVAADDEALVPALLGQAWALYGRLAEPSAPATGQAGGTGGDPGTVVDCAPGCASCCHLRVLATGPEVFLIRRFLQGVVPQLAARGIDLIGPLRQVQARVAGLGEWDRARLQQPCAFVVQGRCVIYQVRTLACRSHVSASRSACLAAAGGQGMQVPHDPRRLHARGLVQNALQSALRQARLAWQLYELHHALLLAWDDAQAETRWRRGKDPLAAAAVDAVPRDEQARVFDQLRPAAG